MEWINDGYMEVQQQPSIVHTIHQPVAQPTTILQQLPPAMPPPLPMVRPGHVREDLFELMMLQNAQMYQVIMNNMTMSALSSFGYSNSPTSETVQYPLPVEVEDPEVYHHHYPPSPYHAYPTWRPFSEPHILPLAPTLSANYRPQESGEQMQPPPALRDRRAVPPPPPPSATGTVGADIPPATEYYDATERP